MIMEEKRAARDAATAIDDRVKQFLREQRLELDKLLTDIQPLVVRVGESTTCSEVAVEEEKKKEAPSRETAATSSRDQTKS